MMGQYRTFFDVAALLAADPCDDCCAAVAPEEDAPVGIAKPPIIGGATEPAWGTTQTRSRNTSHIDSHRIF